MMPLKMLLDKSGIPDDYVVAETAVNFNNCEGIETG